MLNDEKAEKRETGIGDLMQIKFLEERKIFLWGEVNDKSAREVTQKLLYLESAGPGEEITFYINSPGGAIYAGMAIYDTIQLISSPVTIVVTGMAASMASMLLCAAEKGKRLLYPHSRVLIHQPLIAGRMMGAAVDLNIQAQEMEKLRDEMNRIYAEVTGQPLEKIQRDTDRDFYMNAEEAIEYGLADEIVEKA
jgi:ATP-dependent Clp protease protease subunit